MPEHWLPIPGYEGYYSASDQGRVRSEARVIAYTTGKRAGQTRLWNARILKGTIDSVGYKTYTLWRDGVATPMRGHTIVMLTFEGPRPNGLEILHADDIKLNNKYTNLRYGTRRENMADLLRNKGHYKSNRTTCSNGHKYTPDNTVARSGGGRRCRQCIENRKRAA